MQSVPSLREKIIKTASLYFSCLSFGLCASVTGPTLIDLQKIVQTDSGTIALIYLARSGSALVGSIAGGFLFDFTKRKQLLVTFCNASFAVTALVTPWCRDVTTLIVVWAVAGLGIGALDTGCNVLCLTLWGDKTAPFLQAMHFLFGLGGFVAPLIAEPFLDKPCVINVNETFPASNGTRYEDQSSNSSSPSRTIICPSSGIPPVTYAYAIIGGFATLVTIFVFIVSLVYPDKDIKKKNAEKKSESTNKDMWFTILVVILAQVVLSLFCGIEIGYAQMLATFAVKGDLKLSKSTGSFLSSVYWGTFALGRAICIYLSYKFSAFSLVFGDVIAVVVSCSVLIAFGSVNEVALWVGTFLLGFGIASVFPSVITWVEKYIHLNNRIASTFVIAGAFGEMLVPMMVSKYVETEPHMLTYLCMGFSIAGSVAASILWFVMNKKGLKK